jgi:hypothetical protein
MPTDLSNKDGHIFFIKIVSHTFPDKEAHKSIIYEYILKLEITESNNMERFQRELRRHIKQYDAIQGNEWKKITNHIIHQYQKLDSAPLQTGFNMTLVSVPTKVQTKYGWMCALLEWTNITRHDLITRNLWPTPETNNNQELNTMTMHENKWATERNSWGTSKNIAKVIQWPESSTKQTTPISISTATAADRSNISYNPYRSTHVFTKVNNEAPAPTDNVWIGTSHIFLPTFCCSKCDSWPSHHEKLHDEHTRWQAMKNAQLAKQEEYRKQNPHNHYSPPYQQNRSFSHNDNNKRPNNSYDREKTRTNAPTMIVEDHLHEIAPTPRCAALAITTETEHRFMTTRRNTRYK